jgi:hypothetical protein
MSATTKSQSRRHGAAITQTAEEHAEELRKGRQRRRKARCKAAEIYFKARAEQAHRPPARILNTYKKMLAEIGRFGRAITFKWSPKKLTRWVNARAVVEGGASWK